MHDYSVPGAREYRQSDDPLSNSGGIGIECADRAADKSAAHYHSYACDAIIMHSARKGDTYRNENHTLRVESY